MGCIFNIVCFLLWIYSLIMVITSFSIGWLVSLIILTIYFMIIGGSSAGIGLDFIDFD